MDYDIELQFQQLTKKIELVFGEDLDVQAILFLIGVQELGLGYKQFTKQEKTDLLHIAVCTILSPHGYYTFDGRDIENWPHFILNKELPLLSDRDQQHLIKEALLDYFKLHDHFTLNSH